MGAADIGEQARARRHAELLASGGIVLTPNGAERIDVACADGRMVRFLEPTTLEAPA